MTTEIHVLLDRAALAPSRPVDVPDLLRAARRRTVLRRTALVAAPLVAIALVVGAAGSSSLFSGPATPKIVTHSPADAPTKGTMPANLPTRPDGSTDYSGVPDFIRTIDRSGNFVGYVPLDQLLHSISQTVYADDLKTVVGHMYSGRGFVRIGEDPSSAPTLPSTTTYSTAPTTAPVNP